jgi:hypothetical protein
VSFGTPYLLRELPSLPTYIAAYGGQPDVQVAAARALFGEAPITGHLPVTIPGIAPRGAGIRKDTGGAEPGRLGEGGTGGRGTVGMGRRR